MTQTRGQSVQPEPEAGETFKCLPLETCFYPLGPHHKGFTSFKTMLWIKKFYESVGGGQYLTEIL